MSETTTLHVKHTFLYISWRYRMTTRTTTATRTSKNNRFYWAKQQLCTCITLFCTFLCLHCTTTKWNDQISSLLGNWNGKAINSAISVRTWARSPLFTSSQNPLLLSTGWIGIIAKKLSRLKWRQVCFSATFSWTSPLSDRKVPNVTFTEDVNTRRRISFSFTELGYSPRADSAGNHPRKIRWHLSSWKRYYILANLNEYTFQVAFSLPSPSKFENFNKMITFSVMSLSPVCSPLRN